MAALESVQSPKVSYKQFGANIDRTSGTLFEQNGLQWIRVGWDDVARARDSVLGPNISDWSFSLPSGKLLKFLRHPNYSDKTSTISAKDVALVVGNETPKGVLETITLQKYLENYGRYTPGVPDDVNLSSGPNELVTIRYIAVIVPENEDGFQEVVPTCYNYQTRDNKDPKNIISCSFHLGTGSSTDESGKKKVFLVKTKEDGSHENTWFRITNENRETDDQKKAEASVLGTRSTGVGRNRVQCIQIPRKQDKKSSYSSYSEYMGGTTRGGGSYRGMSVGNVSYGSSAGAHRIPKEMTYKRDESQHVTVTFAYYYTSREGILSPEDTTQIIDTLNRSYDDSKAKWTGSLVTGKKDSGSAEEPPIQLGNLSTQTLSEISQKVTQFPKNQKKLAEFPDDEVTNNN